MGVIGKVVTSRLVQPFPATVGSWIEPVLAESDILDRRSAINLALYRSFVDVDPGDAESYFVFANEKRVLTSAMGARTKTSVVRADTKDRRIMCGAPGHGWFTSDWTLQVNVSQSSGAELHVVQRRTIDDSVPNAELLTDSRSGLARALLEGPGEIVVSQTGFNFDDLVEQRHLSTRTPLYGDHLLPIPEGFHDGCRIDLPPDSGPALRASLKAGVNPPVGGREGQEGISLDGGRNIRDCYIELADEQYHPSLVIHLPDEVEMSRQRTFRAALRLLDRLALGMSQSCPEAVQAIRTFIGQCTSVRQSPARKESFVPAWGAADPIGVVVVKPGTQLPLISRVRTTCSGIELDSFMNIASAWVLPRERSWSQGFRQATRDQNRQYTMRGPSQTVVDGKSQRVYRYCEYGPAAPEKHIFTDDRVPWFWQVNGIYRQLDDGRTQAGISVTSLSRAGDILCYAQELARMLAAFEWQIRIRDPDAEFETVRLII